MLIYFRKRPTFFHERFQKFEIRSIRSGEKERLIENQARTTQVLNSIESFNLHYKNKMQSFVYFN